MTEKAVFDDQGYFIRKDFFQPDEIAELGDIVDRIHQQWLVKNREEYVQRQLVNMHSLTHAEYFAGRSGDRRRFFECLAPAKLVTLMDEVFGEGIYFHNSQLFFNPADDSKLPYWHRDLQYGPADEAVQKRELPNMLSLHIRIPLIAERGVELIPGTHRRWDSALERSVRFERDGHRHGDALPGGVLIGLEPGDVLVFHAQMIHRGNYAFNSARKALDLCVGKAHPLTWNFLDEEVLPSQQELEQISDKRWYEQAREVAARRNLKGEGGDGVV